MTEEIIEQLKDLMRIQGNDGNWNYDPYMQGMYNGMEVMLATIEKREPEFKGPPAVWKKDVPMKLTPVADSDL